MEDWYRKSRKNSVIWHIIAMEAWTRSTSDSMFSLTKKSLSGSIDWCILADVDSHDVFAESFTEFGAAGLDQDLEAERAAERKRTART